MAKLRQAFFLKTKIKIIKFKNNNNILKIKKKKYLILLKRSLSCFKN